MKIKMMNENSEQNNTSVEWHEEEVAAKNEQMNLPWNARDGDGRSLGTESAEMKRKRHWVMPGDPRQSSRVSRSEPWWCFRGCAGGAVYGGLRQ
jgi:hypothetical protein